MNDQSLASHFTQKITHLLRVYFLLASLAGFLALWQLLRIPVGAKNALILGLSIERLVLAAGILGVILAAAGMLLASWLRKPFFIRFQEKLTAELQKRSTWGWAIFGFALGLFLGSYWILLTPEITEPFTLAYFERLQPWMWLLSILCAQTLVVLPLLRYNFNLHTLRPQSKILYQIASLLAGFLVIWLLISLTGLGVTASDAGAGWYYLGSPVMENQALLAWGLGMFYLLLALWGDSHPAFLAGARKSKILRTDLILSLLIWAAAFITWNNLPLVANWFVAPPRAPNYAFYPNSDAYLYDTTGQTLLTGEGLKTQNTPFAIRPMYTFFLGVLHALGGVDYEAIIWMQVALLALIPVLLYALTAQIHSRVAGVIAAALIILRESNAIILGKAITTSHAKLLMSDLPTTLGAMLFIFLMVRWLQKPDQRQTLTLIAGGVTGAFMLIRPEFGVLLPFVGFAALLQLIRQPKTWFKGMLLLAIGTLLMLIPWVWRNYQITGTIFLDSPTYRADLFALRYSEYETESAPTALPAQESSPTSAPEPPQITATPTISMQPGESSEAFAERMAQEAADFAKSNPRAVAYFIANHFFNSQIQTVLYLPGTWRLPDSIIGFLGHKELAKFWADCCSANSYIRRLPFWFKWDGTMPRQAWLFVAANLLLISVGLASAWRRQRFAALLPLAASLGYTLINAVVRNSGGRYILAVDWVGMFYYAIGLGQLTLWGLAYFRGGELPTGISATPKAEEWTPLQGEQPPLWSAANLKVATAILLLGCLLPLSEKIIPEHYPAELLAARYTALLQTADLSAAEKSMLANWEASGGQIVQGRALYPRFHAAGEGEAGIRRTPFSPLPFARTDFYLVGPFNHGIVLPQTESPETFPNGADVVVWGCNGMDYFEALAVVIYDSNGEPLDLLLRQPFPESGGCPISVP